MRPKRIFESVWSCAGAAALLLDQGAIAFGELAMRSPRIRAGCTVRAHPLDLLTLEKIVDVHSFAPFSPGKGERDLSQTADLSQCDGPPVSLFSLGA